MITTSSERKEEHRTRKQYDKRPSEGVDLQKGGLFCWITDSSQTLGGRGKEVCMGK